MFCLVAMFAADEQFIRGRKEVAHPQAPVGLAADEAEGDLF